ncbi:MAG: uridine phosphorylase [Alphaproteobacteria bacterium]|nr:MAG: uridine phosphorylase [Alphaproteobacteria bacterium]
MPPLLDNKNPSSPSVFRPAALLREARRQKGLTDVDVPAVCILDPDGDIVRRLRRENRSKPFESWPCYHTQLDGFELAGQTVGIIGSVVGAPFAVLIAEELFASGCRFLLSLTSAGQITACGPFFVGATWTTDAPFRETAAAIEAARSKGVLAVEMEAAALYAFSRASGAALLCLAHVTNSMGQAGQDFEKGEADGTANALAVLEAIIGISEHA